MTSPLLEWRPIDTAPKDGTRVLLSEGADVDIGAWADWGGKAACWETDVDAVKWDQRRRHFEPAYWMPLPSPPKAERAP